MLKVKWLGWANFLVKSSDKVICFDPFFKSKEKADLILISHSHGDHYDIGTINSLKKNNTVIITNEETAKNIPQARVIKIGETQDINGIKVKATYAYNLNIPNHQRGKDLGFIIEAEGRRIYHAGDTDFIKEMKDVENIDLALLPVGGTYTMDTNQALEAIRLIQPKVIIPMHYGEVEVEFQGEKHKIKLEADVEKFKKKVEEETDSKVIILPERGEYNLG